MKLIRPRFRDDVDHATGILAILGVVVARLDTELLHRVRHRKRSIYVGVFVDVIAAVQHIVRLVRAGAICGDRHNTREALLVSLIGALVRCPHHARNQQCEGSSIAAVQRQFIHAGGIDDLRQCSRCRIHLRRIAGYCDRLSTASGLHHHALGNSGIGLQEDSRVHIARKTSRSHGQVIRRGRQRREDVFTLTVRFDLGPGPGPDLHHGDDSPRNDGSGRIRYRPGKSAEALSRQARGGHENDRRKQQETHTQALQAGVLFAMLIAAPGDR